MFVNLEQESNHNIVPELLGQISRFGLLELEKTAPASLAFLFKNYGSPDLLINKGRGGRGSSLSTVISAVREVACHCPSLSIMMVMHHHTIYCFNHYFMFMTHVNTANTFLLSKNTCTVHLITNLVAHVALPSWWTWLLWQALPIRTQSIKEFVFPFSYMC